jgi:UDP:flavonoid glycosyltransferase YjiC (YdhE family)
MSDRHADGLRVLLTTTGYPGHLVPLLPFARAAADAGHEVCLAGPEPARALACEHGLAFCPVSAPPPEELGAIVAAAGSRAPAAGHAHMMAEGFGGASTRAALADVLQLVGAWRPDVVVRESHELAGFLAAEHHGIPHVRVALAVEQVERELVAHVAPGIDGMRRELGLAPDPRGARIAAAPAFTLLPPALDPGGAVRRFREPRPAPAPLPDRWAGSEAPLVYVSFGSVAAAVGYFPDLYRDVVEALSNVRARVLVTVGAGAEPAALGALPEHVHVERWVAQADVLAQAGAVVCHAGFGSVLGALAHRLPLVLLPLFGDDQRENARRVAALGAGIHVPTAPRTMFAHPGDDALAALPAAVERVLDDPRHRAAAARVGAEIDALPPVASAPAALSQIARATVARA